MESAKPSEILMQEAILSLIRTRLSSLIIIILLTLCPFLSPTNSFARDVTLAWDPPVITTDVTGYMIHYGTASGNYSQAIDVGIAISYTVSNLLDGQTYYFTVTSYNAAGTESEYANEISAPAAAGAVVATADGGGGDGSGGGGGCFIATAAFGSYLEPHVRVLRNFRDRYLLTNSLGQAFVTFYYRHSPPIADVIRKHAALRYVTRLALFPLIYTVESPYAMALLFVIPVGILRVYKKRTNNHRSGYNGARSSLLATSHLSGSFCARPEREPIVRTGK